MELVLMANDLWNLVDPEEGADSGDKKALASRMQKAYALIALNLSRSCRDCLRHLKTKDPRAAWAAVLQRFEKSNPMTKMSLLDLLLGLKCVDIMSYISSFNGITSRLQSMGVSFDDDLLVAILLRGFTQEYDMFVAAFKHREKIPPLQEVIDLIHVKHQGVLNTVAYNAAASVARAKKQCQHVGHSAENCWVLHPEKAPV
jgi:hypothetical protein